MHLDPHAAATPLGDELRQTAASDSDLKQARERLWSTQIIAMPTRKSLSTRPDAGGPAGDQQQRSPDTPSQYRPPGYDYLGILKERLDGDMGRIFNGTLVYPRQLEFHLAADGREPCNFHCGHCQGTMGKQSLDLDTRKVLQLIKSVAGRTEYIIFGGQYTEPTMDPLLLDCLLLTKEVGSRFGLTTNGSLLRGLEHDSSFLTKLCIAAEQGDYITISLDAGLPESHRRSKVTEKYWFDEIIAGLRLLGQIKDATNSPITVRICYLLNRWNMGLDEIENIVAIAKSLPLASLRFSVPYAIYGHEFKRVRRYRERWELPVSAEAHELLSPYLSASEDETPYIFFFGPEHQDVGRMDFNQCVHGYYQLTVGADGYVYRCSSIAQPLFEWGRLGVLPDNREQLEEMILRNQDSSFDCTTCFEHGARCNRVALETNTWYDRTHGGASAP